MSGPFNQFGGSAGLSTAGSSAISRNRVLRNTYWLLALTLVPTILGAYIGIKTGLAQAMGSLVFFLVFLIGSIGFQMAIHRTRNSAAGIAVLMAFTLFMGVMLSRLLAFVLGFSNGANLVMAAFGGTALIFAAMATIATVSKTDFSGMGKWLFMGMMVILVVAVANLFFKMTALTLALLVVSLVLFSAYMLYDVQRVVNGGETNYITATTMIYIDIFAVFQNLLSLLGIFGGDRE